MNDIKVPQLNLPNRDELRRLLKTGRDAEGNEAHPDDLKNLRKARMSDLVAFGLEVNKANNNLKAYIDAEIGKKDWILINLVGFLVENGYLPEDAPEKFSEFLANSTAEIENARKFLAEKQDELANAAKPAEVVVEKPVLTIVPDVVSDGLVPSEK